MGSAGVFEVGHEDLVAGLHVDTVGADIHSGGGVAGDGDLIRVGAYKGGEFAADIILLGGEEVIAVIGIGGLHFEVFDEGVEDGFGHGSEGAVVHHDQIILEEKMLSDGVPIDAVGGKILILLI